jgi:predicted nucleotidyltransferase
VAVRPGARYRLSGAVARERYLDPMSSLSGTSLSADELALLERFAEVARSRLGDALHAIWLFGSRARGEPPAHEDSDVDLLVLVDDASWEGKNRVHAALVEAAAALRLESLSPWFAIHIHTPEWLEGRRAIKSFFIAEVDRDKVVIRGSP